MPAQLAIGQLESKIDHLRKARDLEQGRNEVLRLVARNENLELILNKLCQKAQLYNPEMKCSVLRYEEKAQTLHPIASVDLPDFYSNALEGVKAGPSVGSCGTAAFTKNRVIVEDIQSHPYWTLYKGLAAQAGLRACWSEPIIGANGQVYGTFAMYYHDVQSPTEEDLEFIEVSANLAAVVFENDATRKQLLKANNLLNQTIDERNQELAEANRQLALAIEQQELSNQQKISAEKQLTTKALIGGFAHEINTPMGIALTAISSANNAFDDLQQMLNSSRINRKQLAEKVATLQQALTLNENNLLKASELLSKFKEIGFIEQQQPDIDFTMSSLFEQLETSVAKLLPPHKLHLETEHITLSHGLADCWQILYQLVENSIDHGFKPDQIGNIFIKASCTNNIVNICYQDDGIGINSKTKNLIFEPFFTGKRHQGKLGLGLTIISNILNNRLHGQLKLVDSPLGVRFEISLPK